MPETGPYSRVRSSEKLDDEQSEKQGILGRLVSTLKQKSHKHGASASSLSEVTSLRREASRRSHLLQEPLELPPDAELDSLFMSVMRETLGEVRLREVMDKLSRESKWQMICQSGRLEELNQGRHSVEHFVSKFGSGEGAIFDVELVSTLRIQLTNQSLSWIKDFHAQGGTEILASLLFLTPGNKPSSANFLTHILHIEKKRI